MILPLCVVALLFIGAIVYVVYQRYLHPLASYPGPFWASITDLWQVYQFLSLKQPYHLTELHEKYGSFVRYGPDKLSITAEEVIPLVYQKGGRMMPKTEFYDAYGAKIPNVFGMRDENAHSIRRRLMAHSFSISSVKGMEQYLDANIDIMRQKITKYADEQQIFDLQKVLHYYTIDVLGELAFSRSFGAQISDDESLVPPVVEHSWLAACTGAWPGMTATLKRWLPCIPHSGLRAMFKGRAECVELAAESVQQRLDALNQSKERDSESAIRSRRKDILTSLIQATDPETGEHLRQVDLETEAFGFIIAGTHTTSATTSLLFHHLLHAPEIMKKCTSEVDQNLGGLLPDQPAYSVTDVEASLPYLRLCVRENFRVTPVFTMPLARRVTAPEGIVVAGRHIKQGTSVAVCNHAFHHNPEIWGASHNVFDPSRWDVPQISQRARYLMHFGLGGRQCIGKTIAQTNIYKVVSTLLSEFDFQLADAGEREAVNRGDFVGKLPELVSVGISDLAQPLRVTARSRSSTMASLKPTISKTEEGKVEDKEAQSLETGPSEIDDLTDEHRAYLLERHGSLNLEPVPSIDPADPYNWPKSRKITNLVLVAFHAMMGTFTAAAILSAFVDIAKDLDVEVQQASYLTSLVIAILGVAPLFWRPLSNIYGRRPIFLISLACSMIGNIGCAKSPTYATMALCRAITAFFISPAAAIGSAVVSEMFFKSERATFMGAWTIMVTLGVPVAPFLFGFVALRVDYRWIYWILAITNAVQFALYLFLGPETLYRRDLPAQPSGLKKQFFKFGRIDPRPLSWRDFVHPFVYFTKPVVWIPAMSYSMIFLWSSIMPTIEIPQIYPERYGMNTQQVGLQFLSFILGSIIGEQIGGRASDWWMGRRQQKINARPAPEYRLWISYIGQAFAIVGIIVFLVQTSKAEESWNITPLVGTTIAAIGNQIVTTVYITYAVDLYREDAAGVGVFITFVRQIWGFIGPFW
ncbi:benzoate 4-monooxygenase cytochrome P450 [Xylariales sp. AK1849]|nr:benzoate 4-monooxygenase cytochrome P450 [Xylariales sp. AK1849]